MNPATTSLPDVVAGSSILALAHRLLALSPETATFAARGFAPAAAPARERLETVGRTFIAGYNVSVATRDVAAVADLVAQLEPALQPFAVEGAAMGTAVRDALPFARPMLPTLMERFSGPYDYLLHVGTGWSLARVPWRGRAIDRTLDPIHHWLALDGLGFHDTYFRTHAILAGWRRRRAGYAARAYDQGIGRALWFVCGGDPSRTFAGIDALAPNRGVDLASGAGLAMAFAGPAGPDAFAQALALAGPNRAAFAQGIAFACEARARAGHIPTDARAGAAALGHDAEDLAAKVRALRANLPPAGHAPAYETWRRRVAALWLEAS